MSDSRPDVGEPPSLLGAVLGNYRIVAALSTGGMGAVYRARHELLGKPAAIKLLRPELTENDELVSRFFNEAKAATAIRHPGIIEVFDFGYSDDGQAYIVMELLDGQPLGTRIAQRGRLSELEAAHVARGIASALTAAHAAGIIHRDLKPDNVFLVPDPDMPTGERVKVLDFGIAKLAETAGFGSSAQTMTGILMGTPLYMAPEQARAAGDIDHRADLYSLGCILYEMLVGEPPFVAPGAGEIIALQMFGTPEPPSTRLGTISRGLEQIVMRLLEKDPAARFASATEVANALAASYGHLGVSPVTPLPIRHARPAVVVPGTGPVDRNAGTAATMPPGASGAVPMPVGPGPSASLPLPGADEPSPARRSTIPILAGVLTLAIAGGVAVALLARGGGPARPAAPPPPTVANEPPPPLPPPVQEPGPQAAPPPVAAAGSAGASSAAVAGASPAAAAGPPAAVPARGERGRKPGAGPRRERPRHGHGSKPAGDRCGGAGLHDQNCSPIEVTP